MGINYRLRKRWFKKGWKLQEHCCIRIGLASGSTSCQWITRAIVYNIFAVRRTCFRADFVNKYRRNIDRIKGQKAFAELIARWDTTN